MAIFLESTQASLAEEKTENSGKTHSFTLSFIPSFPIHFAFAVVLVFENISESN